MASRLVALFRGINVGSAKRVSMADLRALMEQLGFHGCRTLLNSGNAVFSAGGGRPTGIAGRIEQAVLLELGVAAHVIVLTADEFATVVEDNRLPQTADNWSRVLVNFVGNPASLGGLEPLAKRDWSPEALALGSRAAYLWCPAGITKSPLVKAVGGVLGDEATARNWATVKKVEALL